MSELVKAGGNAMSRPKLKAVVMPDCDKSMKSCDKCEHFDAARRTQSCQAHERYSDAEVIAALVDALKELGVDVPKMISALGLISLYKAYNGDDWAAREAKSALPTKPKE